MSCPLARLSSRLTEVRWGVLFVLLSHSLHLMTLGGKFAGFTECRKQFLDFKRLSAGIFPCKEWASLVPCLSFSTLSHTSRLMPRGAIPDNKYNSSTLVGLRHPMIARHALLSSESSLYACADLAILSHGITWYQCCCSDCTSVGSLLRAGQLSNEVEQKTQHPLHPLHKHTTYLNTPRLKHYLQQQPLHNKHFHKPPHSLCNIHKNKYAQHTHIYCLYASSHKRYLPTTLVAPLLNTEQIRRPFLNHTYTMSRPNHIHHHYFLFVTLTHTSSLQLHPHTHHVVTPGFVDRPRRCYGTACQMYGEADGG